MRYGRLGLSIGPVVLVSFLLTSGTQAISPVISSRLSYFFGVKDPSDTPCYTRTIPKHSTLPVTVSYTNPTFGHNIHYVTIEADRYSPKGFTVDKIDGQLRTLSISYRINGPSPTPYEINVNMLCDPFLG